MVYVVQDASDKDFRLIVACDVCGNDLSSARAAAALIFAPPTRGGRSRALWACKSCATSSNARQLLASGPVERMIAPAVLRKLCMSLLHESVF